MFTSIEIQNIENQLKSVLNAGTMYKHNDEVGDIIDDQLEATPNNVCILFNSISITYPNTTEEIGNYQYNNNGIKIAIDKIVYRNKNPRTGRSTSSTPTLTSTAYLADFYPASQKNTPQSYLYLLIVEFDPTVVNSVAVKLELIEKISADFFRAPTTGRGQIQLPLAKLNTNTLYTGTRADWMRKVYTTVLASYIDDIQKTLSDIKKYMQESSNW